LSFIAVGVTAGVGITQAVIGGVKAGKAHREMENLKTPTYAGSQPLSQYYQEALNRYQQSPYQSNFYEQAQKAAGRNQATAIGATMDRHSAGNIGAIVQGSDDQMQKAGVQAEGLQRQAFGQLGSAANAQTGDIRQQFQYNQEAPYEKAFGIAQGKAIAGSQMENAGFSNISGGLGSYSQIGQLKQLYGGGGSGGGGGASTNAFAGGGGQYSASPGLANTGGGYTDPAGGIGYINPNGFGAGAIAGT
jgi:hypothetical protein